MGLADDVTINATPVTACAAYADQIDLQRAAIGLSENLKKAAAYSPQGDLDCVPAALPGSPHHRDEEGNLTGRLQCFKMVGSYHGDDGACTMMTDVRLRKKLAPLDRMDRARETEYITNVGQLKHNVLRHAVAPVTHFTAQTIEPSVAHVPLHNASMRISESRGRPLRALPRRHSCCATTGVGAGVPTLSEGYGGFNLMPAPPASSTSKATPSAITIHCCTLSSPAGRGCACCCPTCTASTPRQSMRRALSRRPCRRLRRATPTSRGVGRRPLRGG